MGMRVTQVYKIDFAEGNARLSRYWKNYSRECGDQLEPEKSVACTEQRLVELMNSCGVIHWDGFHGAHPKYVLDGTMFRFSATVNRNRTIHADGSENFPKGYREFVRGLNEWLAE